MSIFDCDIDRIAKNLVTAAKIYEVTYDEAWNNYTSLFVRGQISFEEVLAYIYKYLEPPFK